MRTPISFSFSVVRILKSIAKLLHYVPSIHNSAILYASSALVSLPQRSRSGLRDCVYVCVCVCFFVCEWVCSSVSAGARLWKAQALTFGPSNGKRYNIWEEENTNPSAPPQLRTHVLNIPTAQVRRDWYSTFVCIVCTTTHGDSAVSNDIVCPKNQWFASS